MRGLNHGAAKPFSRGHRAWLWQRQELSPGPIFETTTQTMSSDIVLPWFSMDGTQREADSNWILLCFFEKNMSLHSLSCLRECSALDVFVTISQLDNLTGDWLGGHVQSHRPTERQRWPLTSNLCLKKKMLKKKSLSCFPGRKGGKKRQDMLVGLLIQVLHPVIQQVFTATTKGWHFLGR